MPYSRNVFVVLQLTTIATFHLKTWPRFDLSLQSEQEVQSKYFFSLTDKSFNLNFCAVLQHRAHVNILFKNLTALTGKLYGLGFLHSKSQFGGLCQIQSYCLIAQISGFISGSGSYSHIIKPEQLCVCSQTPNVQFNLILDIKEC